MIDNQEYLINDLLNLIKIIIINIKYLKYFMGQFIYFDIRFF